MKYTVHQSQLSRLRHDPVDWRTLRHEHVLSFGQWLEQHVGAVDQDWGRVYNLQLDSPEYGTTWWFKRSEDLTLCMLRWS